MDIHNQSARKFAKTEKEKKLTLLYSQANTPYYINFFKINN